MGLLVDRAGFPLQVGCWEGNKAETTTIILIVEAFRTAHGIAELVVVADADVLSAASLTALDEARLRFIVGARQVRAPGDLEAHFHWHGDAPADGQVIDTITPEGAPRTSATSADIMSQVRICCCFFSALIGRQVVLRMPRSIAVSLAYAVGATLAVLDSVATSPAIRRLRKASRGSQLLGLIMPRCTTISAQLARPVGRPCALFAYTWLYGSGSGPLKVWPASSVMHTCRKPSSPSSSSRLQPGISSTRPSKDHTGSSTHSRKSPSRGWR